MVEKAGKSGLRRQLGWNLSPGDVLNKDIPVINASIGLIHRCAIQCKNCHKGFEVEAYAHVDFWMKLPSRCAYCGARFTFDDHDLDKLRRYEKLMKGVNAA